MRATVSAPTLSPLERPLPKVLSRSLAFPEHPEKIQRRVWERCAASAADAAIVARGRAALAADALFVRRASKQLS